MKVLDVFDRITPKSWRWDSGAMGVGFVYEELEEVTPVLTAGEGPSEVALLAVLYAKVQELDARVRELEQ